MALPNIIQQINSKLSLSGGTIKGGNLIIEGGYNSLQLKTSSNEVYSDIAFIHSNNIRKGFIRSTVKPETQEIAIQSVDVVDNTTKYYSSLTVGYNHTTSTPFVKANGHDIITSAGGTLTGSIGINSGQTVYFGRNNNINGCFITHSQSSNGASEMSIHSCSNSTDPYTGACMYLHTDKDSRTGLGGEEGGGFCLSARRGGINAIQDASLQGYPNGKLFWQSKPMTQIGFPDYSKYYATGIPQNPTTSKAIFTAPVDGWFHLNGQRYPAGYTLYVTINDTISYWAGAHQPDNMNICVPLKQGDYVHVYTDAGSATWTVYSWFYGCRGNP
jgi:hypothetical protein